jgi:M6 family metalloprotease-like protein
MFAQFTIYFRITMLALAWLALPGGTDALRAQDVEVTAQKLGLPVPAGYLQRVRDGATFDIRRGWKGRAAIAAATNQSVEGTFPVLVIPMYFADSAVPSVPVSELQRVLFDGPNPAGTLTEYYAQASGGRLRVEGVVTPWVRASVTVAEARGATFGLGADAQVGRLLVDGLRAADAQLDFTLFDNDGPDGIPNSGDDDGFVDAFAMEFQEEQLTCQGQGPTIWGHRWVVSGWNEGPFQSEDIGINGEPIKADDYFTQAAVRCSGGTQTMVVIAHEFGHILGLPDLYDRTEGRLPGQRNWVVGCWSIMAAGQWGCGPALAEGRWDRPTFFAPWEKREMGWDGSAQVVGKVLDEEFVLRPAGQTGDFLEVPLSGRERLFIEYRDGSTFDANLPASGVLVYHVDDSRPVSNNRCRSCPRIYRVALMEADANGSLITPEGQGGNRGQAGDIFSTSGRRILNSSTPSTRLNSGAPSDVSIYSIVIDGGVARIRLSTEVLGMGGLLGGLLGEALGTLSAEERDYADRLGNNDGAYDLGDLRQYVLDHPSAVARWESRR